MKKLLQSITSTFFVLVFIAGQSHALPDSMANRAQWIETENGQAFIAALKKTPPGSLLVLDVDEVLMQPSDPAYQWHNRDRQVLLFREVFDEFVAQCEVSGSLSKKSDSYTEDVARIRRIALAIEYAEQKYEAMSADLNAAVKEALERPDIKIVCLTHAMAELEIEGRTSADMRVQNLRELGLDFTGAFLGFPRTYLDKDILSKWAGFESCCRPVYQDGVIFTGRYPKAHVLELFLKEYVPGFSPTFVGFVDDRWDNVDGMREYLVQLEVPSELYHFTKIEKAMMRGELPSFDEEKTRQKLKSIVLRAAAAFQKKKEEEDKKLEKRKRQAEKGKKGPSSGGPDREDLRASISLAELMQTLG